MFGYVTQKEFDFEHELRLKAEAREELLRQQLKEESERHERQIQDLLDRYQPKPVAAITGSGERVQLSSEELRRMPAIGKRGMAERHRLVGEAEAREKDNHLSSEEAAELDKVISNNGHNHN